MADFLVDTNVLLRLILPHDPLLAVAEDAISELLARNDTLFTTSQNLIKFWAVATRPIGPPATGLGLSILDAQSELTRIRSMFGFLPDTDRIIVEWEKLAVSPGCIGKQAHDA